MKIIETKIKVSDLVENYSDRSFAPMSDKGISVPCALQMASTPNTLLRIWKATTSFLGAKAGIPQMTISRCCARSAIRQSRIDKADMGRT